MGGDQQKRRTRKSQDSHEHIIVKDDKKGGNKMVKCDDDGWQPGDGIARYRTDIRIKPVQNIAVIIPRKSQPV